MKKVLIVSYFFPPCNLTASQRALSWARYLKQYGYYPVILTRRWDHKVNALADVSKPTPNKLLHEVKEDYEVYYLPYQPNWRDRLYVKYGEHRYAALRRLLTFFELIMQYASVAFIPYKNIFEFAGQLAAKDRDIKKVVITGNPFNLFRIGYSLHKKFGLKWIADYRDAWSTSEINFTGRPAIFKWLNVLDRYFEKKWVATASYITASSGPIAESVGRLTGVPAGPLYNGFIKEDFDGVTNGKFQDFTITYVGTLYPGQKVEIFCTAFKQLIDKNPGIKARLYFPGLAFYTAQAQRVEKALQGYGAYFECTQRMERQRILEIEKKSHLLLHVAWDEQQGIIASKIYEYIASGTFIVVTPTDGGSIQQIVQASGCGVCTATTAQTYAFLQQEYDNFKQGRYRENNTADAAVLQFSRQNQVMHLAELLNRI